MVDVVGAVVRLTDVGADELGAEVLGVAVVGLTDVGEDVLGVMLGFEVVGLAVALTDVVVSELSGFEEGIGGGLVLFLSNIAAPPSLAIYKHSYVSTKEQSLLLLILQFPILRLVHRSLSEHNFPPPW